MRYVDQVEKDKRKEQVLQMRFDEPITTYKRWLVAFPKTCEVTGERIPALSIAYKKEIDYLIRDEIQTDVTWVSEAGYILEKLKGNVCSK